ncbi:hypothetical protein VQ643_06935 [Pseudomonas sp. F1_0610]|uniref:hypothetical protein n=1 Tax=Pseudomonas sp. F1_0610 TaxID=3114284 RepID=UPI0039C385EE
MKNVILSIFLLALVGCSDSESSQGSNLNASQNDGYSAYEKDYMEGCTKGRNNQAFCQCTFNHMKKQISLEEMERIDRGLASAQDKEKLTRTIVQVMMECQSSY